MKKNISFYSEGVKLDGDLYYPDDMKDGEQRAGVVLCHGYTGVKDLYLPDNARVLNEAGYMVMTFDYKGWGESEGARTRLAPYSRVADVQSAMTFLQIQPEVDEDRIGIYGTSYGCATVVWVAAHDERVKCTVGVVGMGHGARWMRSVRRPDEWVDLLEVSKKDRERARRQRCLGNGTSRRYPAARPAIGGISLGCARQQPERLERTAIGIHR